MKFDLFNLQNDTIDKYLNENDFKNEFSLIKKIYYNFARPIMPKSVKNLLQKQASRKVKCRENFIWDELVRLVREKKTEWSIYPDQSVAALVLTHDVDTLEGFRNIPEIILKEQELGFKSSWNIVPYKYKLDQGIINFIKDAGHEIGIHGFNHDGKLFYSEKIFDKRVPYINEAIEKYGAKGFRAPMVHRNLKWLQKLNIEYDASCFDYDPYQPFPGGTGSIWPYKAGKFIELPYTLPQDHDLFYMMKTNDISIWRKKTDWLIENNGVILLNTHPDYLTGEYSKHYDDYLRYIKTKENIWHILAKEIAVYWKENFTCEFVLI